MLLMVVLMACTGEGESGAAELWQAPGGEGTASWAGAAGVDGCREFWQDDAHPISVFRLPQTSWSITTASVSDPDNYCLWSDYIDLDAEPSIELLPAESYDPGYTVSAEDEMTGWTVDSTAVEADFSLPEGSLYWVQPAAHRRQSADWADALEGLPDDLPVILAGEGISGPEYFLIDGRTGAQLN